MVVGDRCQQSPVASCAKLHLSPCYVNNRLPPATANERCTTAAAAENASSQATPCRPDPWRSHICLSRFLAAVHYSLACPALLRHQVRLEQSTSQDPLVDLREHIHQSVPLLFLQQRLSLRSAANLEMLPTTKWPQPRECTNKMTTRQVQLCICRSNKAAFSFSSSTNPIG